MADPTISRAIAKLNVRRVTAACLVPVLPLLTRVSSCCAQAGVVAMMDGIERDLIRPMQVGARPPVPYGAGPGPGTTGRLT